MSHKFTVADIIPASPREIYDAWLDSEAHGAMTGTKAKASPKVGDKYMATDDYIWGTNLELVPGKKIVQSWRSTDFVDGEKDSVITVTLEPVAGGTMLTLQHSDIPDTQADGGYEQGWFDYYFEPMKSYSPRPRRR